MHLFLKNFHISPLRVQLLRARQKNYHHASAGQNSFRQKQERHKNKAAGQKIMRDHKNIHPILFLDDWPSLPDRDGRNGSDQDHPAPGMNSLRKWRIQTLLAVNPWGIPVMAFKKAYQRMYPGKVFEPKEHGYETIGAMVYNLPDIFAVQEPDDVTALMFPDYPHDKILHDARLGHQFATDNKGQPEPNELGYASPANLLESAIDSQRQIASRWSSSSTGGDPLSSAGSSGAKTIYANQAKTIDPDILISYAWIHRDTDFPPDVVLAGEQYSDLILPMTSANIPGTRGVHKAKIVGVASPSNFYINVKSSYTPRVESLTSDIYQFFMQCKSNIDSYSVPEEFIYPGFPCLIYSRDFKCWERCVVVGRSSRTNRVLVEYVDFGGIVTVNRIYLYLMPRRFLDLPKQAINCSLIGVRPKKGNDKWSRNISCRLRFFSQPSYWLDALLMDPKVEPTTNNPTAANVDKSTNEATAAEIASTSTPTSATDTLDSLTFVEQSKAPEQEGQRLKPKRKKRVIQRKLDFEAILCDRYDQYGLMDIFLNDILVMETYGSYDADRGAEYESLKDVFMKALATLPRPENLFYSEVSRFWPVASSGICTKVPKVEVKYDDDDEEA